MRCPVCQEETPAGKRFCANCGRSLTPAVCTACGAELVKDKPFCADCGAPATGLSVERASDIAPSDGQAASVAERRICSLLFVDLVGFTPLVEKRDPEQVRELLSQYFARAQTIIEHYGGSVEKFIGDAVMAVWGAPTANEDDAERAVRAALDVVAAVADLGRESDLPSLEARAGVVTGEVAATIGGTGETMVLGDAVNSASRLQSAAAAGTVLVDEMTRRATSNAITFSEIGELSLKGKSDTVRAWQALRVVAQRRGVGRSEGIEPPFVGRDPELRLMKDLLHATITERRVRLVSVTGVPGIGKSRLAWEFLKYVDGLADTVYWHQGRSPAYGEGITFWALGEMVRSRARIAESEDPAESRAKLVAAIAEFVTDPDERRWVEPRLAHLLGLADSPGGEREELFSAWRTFFERISENAPAVMVFEDLQWADPGMIDFIESILEWSRTHPIFVVTLARPELIDRRPTWGAGQRSFFSVHLEPLAPSSMREMLAGFVRGLPERERDEIIERSEGVPLYAVEMVRAFVDNELLDESEGSYVVTGDLSGVPIPETLHALIGSRLDALPPEQRKILQDGAVLGSTFSLAALAALEDVHPDKLDAELRDLVRKEFLSFDTNPLSPERGQFAFVQALIQDVAQSRLSRRDRGLKHLSVARHYESLGDKELAAVVAAHYFEASRVLPERAAAEEAEASAKEWLRKAAERAQSLGSSEQAESLLRRLLEVTHDADERRSVADLAGEAALAAGHYRDAVDLFEEAIAAHLAAGDPSAAGTATTRLATALYRLGRLGDALGRVQAVLESEPDLDRRSRAELTQSMARYLSWSGHSDEALVAAETALTLAERGDDTRLLCNALGVRANALFNLGRPREAIVLERGAAELAESSALLRAQSVALVNLSGYVLGDDPVAAISYSRDASELARRAGDRGLELGSLLNTCESSIYTGDWDGARAILSALHERHMPEHERGTWQLLVALLQGLSDDPAGALIELDRLETFRDSEDFAARTTILNARSMVRLVAGDLAGAGADADGSLALEPNGLNAPIALVLAARSRLWGRDASRLAAIIPEMSRVHGRWISLSRRTMETGLSTFEDGQLAADRYRELFDGWSSLGSRLDLLFAQLDCALLLGGDASGATFVRDLRHELAALGAMPLVARLEAAIR